MLDALSQTVVPPKPALWRRWTALPVFSYYNRLAALVLLSNLAFAVLGVGLQGVSTQTLSSLVLINLSLAILIRQQYLINALFWLATRIPVTWPLRVRRSAAKVYHVGGLHSGAALAATGWFAGWVGVQAADYLQRPGSVSFAGLWLGATLLGVLLLMVGMAQPRIRGRFHNGFERVHRFAGWAALLLFWALTLLASVERGASLLHSGAFWMLVLLTLSIALPWLRLRKVAVEHTRPSRHAVITRFTHTTPFAGSSTAISRHPLLE